MSIKSVRLLKSPKCELCGAPMVFFDEAWPETNNMLVASLLCLDCGNTSVIHINIVSIVPASEYAGNLTKKQLARELVA